MRAPRSTWRLREVASSIWRDGEREEEEGFTYWHRAAPLSTFNSKGTSLLWCIRIVTGTEHTVNPFG